MIKINNLHKLISEKIIQLDKNNEDQRKDVKLEDFRRTYEEGYVEGVEDTLMEIREVLRDYIIINKMEGK
ncbi:MAG: hypothetical protein ABF289_18070 [Clostridiales bacterium]